MTALPIHSIDAEMDAARQEQLGLELPFAAYDLRTIYISWSKIHPDPEQPRRQADDELRADIREAGILQPVSVRHAVPQQGFCSCCARSWIEIAGAAEYVIVFGERRWRGAEGVMEKIPAIVRDDLSSRDPERRKAQLSENANRKGLTAVEEALHLERILQEEPGLSLSRLALQTGVKRSVISDRLAALRHPRFRPLFIAGVISSSQAVEAARFAEYSETDHERAWAKLVAMHPSLTVEELFAGLDVDEFRAVLDIAYQVSTRDAGQLVVEVPMACGRCGCTEERACEGGCSWVSTDPPVCSGCVREDEEVREEPCAHCQGTGDLAGSMCKACEGCGSTTVLAKRPPSISAMRAEQRNDDAREESATAPSSTGATHGDDEDEARGEAVERESAPGATWGNSSPAQTPGTAAPAVPPAVEEHAMAASESHGTATAAKPEQASPASPLPVGIFAALAPLLADRGVILSTRLLEAGRFHVIVMPGPAEGRPGLAPLVVRGTIEELDTELAGAIARYIAGGPAEVPAAATPARPISQRASSSAAKKRAAKKASKAVAQKPAKEKKAPARKAAPAKKPASSTAKRRGKAVPEAAPEHANTQEARAVEPVESEGQASVEAATNAVSGEAVTGANETLGDVGGEQSGSSTGPTDTAAPLDEFSASVLDSVERGIEATTDEVQPYYRAYMHAEGFTDPAELRARDVNNVPFMAWLNGQRRDFRASRGLDPDQPFQGAGEGDAFGAYLASRWPAPLTTTTED